jgi:hypothetical protein
VVAILFWAIGALAQGSLRDASKILKAKAQAALVVGQCA